MTEKKISFILIQINKVHSLLWPVSPPNQTEPQENIEDRLIRANNFVTQESVPFIVLVDTWSNEFAENYHAWPDKYVMIDNNLTILEMSKYGSEENTDAKIQLDSLDLVLELIK